MRVFCGAENHGIAEFDVATGEMTRSFAEHPGGLRCLDISPDGTMLASGSTNTHVLLWSTDSTKLLRCLSGHSQPVRSVCFSRNSAQLASGSEDHSVRLWEAASGRLLRTLGGSFLGLFLRSFEGHAGFVYSVHFSADGARLASGSLTAP